MLIKHWREQFINIAEDHSVHSHKRRELCYFNHIEKKSLPPFHIKHRSVHLEHPFYCTQVPLRTPVLHDATRLHYCVQLSMYKRDSLSVYSIHACGATHP